MPNISRAAFRASQAEQGELYEVEITPLSDQGLNRQQALLSALLTTCQSCRRLGAWLPHASSGMFRGALERRRCLVHADAFYAWRAMPDGKQPYAIGREDRAPLAFAGVWEGWRGPDGETLRSFAILTTAANGTMQALHDRMPVILGEEHWPVWLGERAGEPTSLMRPTDDDLLSLWAVSQAVNNLKNNSPDLLDRIDDPHAPPPSDAPPGDNPA